MKKYQPLIVVICFAVLVAHIFGYTSSRMQVFMGIFFMLLAMFKFFDLKGFDEGFRTYDLAAKHIPHYGYLYPFVELGLGTLYLLNVFLRETLTATIILMVVSGVSVVDTLRRGEKLTCACMGTVLNVPLSTVSLVENLGMGVMAAYMLNQ